MKVGDLVRLRATGMPRQHRGFGIVLEICKKSDVWQKPARWEGDDWDSVRVYWAAGHRMNDRWMVRSSLEVINESR
tara:strand:- start:1643 stop:1870 length:228 start_codon:yes stop_codon:yes gene_type:complete